MGNETNLNAAQNNHIFTGKGGKMYKRISFVLIVAFAVGLFGTTAPARAQMREVPDVVGMFWRWAEMAIYSVDLSTGGTTLYECSNTVPEGFVISQYPEAGTELPWGSIVYLTISYCPAPETVVIPDVVGMGWSDAFQALLDAGLERGHTSYVCSSTGVPDGHIISQYPAAGTEADFGSWVSLQISTGPCPLVEVPDVVGWAQAPAESAITADGLSVGTIGHENSDTVPEGFVIRQDPAGGTSVPPGSAVDLTISLGLPGLTMVEVPDVVGLSMSQAEQAFWSAGFTTLFEMYAHSDTVPQGHVISQEPAGGELVPIDSSPEIVISLGPETGETTVEVPDVVGLPLSQAEQAFWSAGFNTVLGTYAHSSTVPYGCVISQSPGAGTEVDVDTEVVLIISMGPEPDDVPPVPGPPVPVPPVPVPPVPVPPVPVEPDASCLLAHWKLDDGSGNTAIDSSDNGFDITLHNTTWEDGVFGGAVHFHGVGYGDVWDFNYSQNAITVCAWVWHDEFRIEQIERYVTVGQGIAVIRKEYDGRLHFYIDTGGNYFQHLWVDDVLTVGQWHHVAGTWDGLNQRLYIDGVEIASQAPGGVLGQTSHVRISSEDEPFNGMLDDVRIYNCALDENQIQYLISPPPSLNTLSEALDTALSFNTGGSADWFSQTTTSYHDGDAAQSGDISGDQESWMQTTVSGKGTVKFYWMVSSEEKYDCLEFYIDGVLQEKISGFFEDYWVQKTYTISTSGSHVLEWRYIKDGITDYGSDCGRVDKVEWMAN